MTVNVLKGIPGIGAMIVDAATAEKTCARHGKNALKNIKPNAPKPPKAMAVAAAHKAVETVAAHSNGAPRVMTFAKPLPSASSNLPNPAKK